MLLIFKFLFHPEPFVLQFPLACLEFSGEHTLKIAVMKSRLKFMLRGLEVSDHSCSHCVA